MIEKDALAFYICIPCSETSFPMTLTFPFTKMHGLGNDFVVTRHEWLPAAIDLSQLTVEVCDRHFGIGADGFIVITPPTDPTRFDTQFVYFNGDGSRAEMCGNGIRCFARYLVDNRLIDKTTFTVETPAGLIKPTVHPDGTVTVDMGCPILTPNLVPFTGTDSVNVLEHTIAVAAVSMGNPHCVIFQDDLPSPLDPAVFGPAIEIHPTFPEKTNVEFVTQTAPDTLSVVVWERGCGFTLACGTGACAVAVAAQQAGKSGNNVNVDLPGGRLVIEWSGNPADSVLMTGPATTVFEGTYPLAAV